jgi:hypothetical protein
MAAAPNVPRPARHPLFFADAARNRAPFDGFRRAAAAKALKIKPVCRRALDSGLTRR